MGLVTRCHVALLLQLTDKEREAEFWRIVEDGEDVVEVCATACYRCPVAAAAAAVAQLTSVRG
jgi:hypothetical protein